MLLYGGPIDNPPPLMVSDIARIVIRTNFTNAVTETHEIALAELADPPRPRLLKHVFADPEQLRPARTRQALTEDAAAEFAELARRLRVRGNDPQAVAHFVNRLVFCMFADDVGLRFRERLRRLRVLDPACGSGIFLLLSLRALKDLEHQSSVEAEASGLQRKFPLVGPETMLGIEINPYAAGLARMSVSIGHIRCPRLHGLAAPANPVLQPLDTIECRDAVLTPDGKAAEWVVADDCRQSAVFG